MVEPPGIEDFLRSAAVFLEKFEGNREAAAGLIQIAERVRQPFNLAVVGRMKAGKSTLINGLIGHHLAISDVEEATATFNWICHGSHEQIRNFVVHWKDGRSESFPLSDLSRWTGKAPEVLARVRETLFLRLFSDSPKLAEIQIVDTPGTGSAVEEHETARELLNPETISQSLSEMGRADAIIYVVPPVAREADMETLRDFSTGQLPNSGPYNSVAVLHKWDDLSVNDPIVRAKDKAHRLLEQLEGMVADVIPVSGPLALAARSAPDEFFGELLSMVQTDRSGVERALTMPDRWAKDTSRQAIREKHAMPWSSFKLLVHLCLKEEFPSPAIFRRRCEEESGILTLEAFLQERFFSRASIIKKCQLLNRAALILEPTLRKMDVAARQENQDAQFADRAAEFLKNTDAELSGWLLNQAVDHRNRSETLQSAAVDTDRQWQEHRSELERLQMDLRVSQELKDRSDLFPEEHRGIIQTVCNHLADPRRRMHFDRGQLVSLRDVENLIGIYRGRENLSRNRDRPLFSHVVSRLEEIHVKLLES